MHFVIGEDHSKDGSVLLQTPVGQKACANPRPGVHVNALDGLRGLAVLLVIFYHLGASAQALGGASPIIWPTEIGWCGVDLFFVLSGFLITGILFDSKQSLHYFRNFYARRILRIMPLYYGAILLVAALSLAWPSVTWWGLVSPLWLVFYLQNFIIALKGPVTGILTHYWSLAVEEHFYLVWPLLIWGLSRHRMIQIASALVIAAFGLRAILVTQGVSHDALFALTPTRIDALAIGGLISLASRGPGGLQAIIPKAWIVLPVSAALMLIIIIMRDTLRQDDPAMQTLGYSLLAAMFGSLIIIGITWPPMKAVLNLATLRWFGKYSYGLYIWHPIIGVIILHSELSAAFNLQDKSHLIIALTTTFALSLLSAWLSYNLLEKRFLDLKRYFVD